MSRSLRVTPDLKPDIPKIFMALAWSPAIAEQYRKRVYAQAWTALRAGTLLGAALFSIYIFLDFLIHPAEARILATIKVFSSAFFFGMYLLLRKGLHPRDPFWFTQFCFVVASFALTAECAVLGGYSSAYYADIAITICVSLLFPWNAARMAVQIGTVVFVYAAGMFVFENYRLDEGGIFLTNLSVLSAIGISSVVVAGFTERLRKQGFLNLVEAEQSRAELARHDEIKTRFFANVSHELRTPLSLILGPVAEMLTRKSLSIGERDELLTVERNAKVLLKHVNDLMTIARTEAKKFTLRYSRQDLAYLVRRSASNFEWLAQSQDMALEVHTPNSFLAEVDAEKIDAVLTNLLSNAFKFTPAGGRVRCELISGEHDDLVILKVSDNGPGIPLECRDSVFERFFQVEESATRRKSGTGLGLAIARDFVEMHRGTIAVDEALGGGAVFTVVLPVRATVGIAVDDWSVGPEPRLAPVELAATGMEIREVEAESSDEAANDNGNVRSNKDQPLVLVVEDNPDMTRFIRRALQSRNFRVECAGDGKQGLEKALTFQPDLILTDMMMPVYDGMSLIQSARREPLLADIPILVLTAKTDDELRLSILQEGAQDFLLKPFSAEELLIRISNWVEVKKSKEILQAELSTERKSLHDLASEIAAKKRDLQKALSWRDCFISIASHELRTPLAGAKIQMHVVETKLRRDCEIYAKDEILRKSVGLVQEQIVHLSHLVEKMFDLSRVDRGEIELKRARFDLRELVDSVLRKYEDQLKSQGIFVNVTGVDSVSGYWDRSRIEQIATNLLTNALKYGGSKPIEIHLWEDPERAYLEIRDSGIGIAIEDQDRIFERFERAVPYQKISGLGVGLYISREIALAHGGNITVESRVREGSVFTVSLPKSGSVGLRTVGSEEKHDTPESTPLSKA